MCAEESFANATRLEERKTKKYGISGTFPDRRVYVARGRDALQQDRVYRHADQDQETLESEREQWL